MKSSPEAAAQDDQAHAQLAEMLVEFYEVSSNSSANSPRVCCIHLTQRLEIALVAAECSFRPSHVLWGPDSQHLFMVTAARRQESNFYFLGYSDQCDAMQGSGKDCNGPAGAQSFMIPSPTPAFCDQEVPEWTVLML